MPIARRPIPLPRRRRAAETATAAVVAALVVPAVPAAAVTTDCRTAAFTARTQADLAKIAVLDPGPLHRDLPALADVRLGSSRGEADSGAKLHKAVATARYADAKLLGISTGQASAIATAPRSKGPASVDLATVGVAGLGVVKSGTATAEATWEDGYRCGKTGPLTRSATMLAGLSVLGGKHGAPVLHAVDDATHLSRKTSLLRAGPSGSTQSATDLVRIKGGQVGVRAGAGAALGDLSLFAGTPHEIGIKVVNQATLEVVAAADQHKSRVDYKPAVLKVSSGGKQVNVLQDAGADLSLGVDGSLSLPGGHHEKSGIGVRVSVGEATSDIGKRTVSAEAATVRVEVTVGKARLLDVALGYLSVSACAPGGGSSSDDHGDDRDRGDHGPGSSPSSPGGSSSGDSSSGGSSSGGSSSGGSSSGGSSSEGPQGSAPADSASASPSGSASASPSVSVKPVALGEPLPANGGTGGGALALTGTNVAVLVIGGAALVLFGVGALMLGRRRRSVSGS
ncbi:hypothetical protein AMIS_17240 [Actinoplanes missouriensis 431]|uniref:Gram-positive cocci surface proteins LPxTG domain-containing protein n=1 Tax=Actinoplanes missouriensis (strain ATCC 14538 / DSM 43046 / CBS 188.64 / JCM 3121 / NBRC 102363 / NCIMB 12654 / NRRL B-3342 / UNCC 431) TaxID=512565 RepID=I0H1Q7_ACTM4|nr:hypothetical protein [Actinoplanes missouriensis]BAL86944.1 hypothetical protein AMIS_17240 [Actinoplanes missouriensis 431]